MRPVFTSACPGTPSGQHEPLMIKPRDILTQGDTRFVDKGKVPHYLIFSDPQPGEFEDQPAYRIFTMVCIHCGGFYSFTKDEP